MTTTTTTQETAAIKNKRALETTQVAWMVLGTAFVAFCFICASVSFGAYYFVYQSTVPMVTTAQVAKGAVRLIGVDQTESFEEVGRTISRGERVVTDSQSQVATSFREQGNDTLVSLVTVKNNSEIQLLRGLQPRFERSSSGYSVGIMLDAGEIDVFVPPLLPRDATITVHFPGGTLVDISESGFYTISLTDTELMLSVDEGRAAIIPPDRNTSRSLEARQAGRYIFETDDIVVDAPYVELVNNSTFAVAPAGGASASQPLLPIIETWNCSHRSVFSPMGIFEQVFFEGRYTVRLFRGIGTETHGETECIQPFGPSAMVGRRVAGYETLELRTSFYVQGHSLEACGIQGSECPMMLLMDYIDENGRSNQWFQGFYAQLTSRLDYPLTCASCSRDHVQINTGVWYTYESGNLFALLPEGARPASILNVRFYASGHDYDVYVGNLSLVASPSNPSGDSVEAASR